LKKNTEVYHIKNGKKIQGIHSNIRGDVSGIQGDVSGICGDVSGIKGDVSSIGGYVSGIWGNIDMCELSKQDRKNGVDIKNLIK